MKYAIDRIEEKIVVLENLETGEEVLENIKILPKGVHEGSIVIYENNLYLLDEVTEKERKERLRERLERLKKLKK